MINQDNVQNLFSTSKMLQFWDVAEACSQFFKKKMQPDNCLGIKSLVKAHDDNDFVSKYDSWIV